MFSFSKIMSINDFILNWKKKIFLNWDILNFNDIIILIIFQINFAITWISFIVIKNVIDSVFTKI